MCEWAEYSAIHRSILIRDDTEVMGVRYIDVIESGVGGLGTFNRGVVMVIRVYESYSVSQCSYTLPHSIVTMYVFMYVHCIIGSFLQLAGELTFESAMGN